MAGKPKGQKRAAKVSKRNQKRQAQQRQVDQYEMPGSPLGAISWDDDSSRRDLSNDPMKMLDMSAVRRLMERKLSQFASEAEGTPRDPVIEQAEELIDQAMQVAPAKAKKLARQALELWPDCADAYVVLAEHASMVSEALPLYEQGVAAGRRALADEWDEIQGHFWGYLPSRPFLRALAGFADALWGIGRREESAAQYLELLSLNPNDNQGIRMAAIPRLMELGRDDDCRKLLKQYEDGEDCFTAYTSALMEFRRKGDSAKARSLLQAAFQANEHVPKFLVTNRGLPNDQPGSYSWKTPEEAQIYVDLSQRAWKATPGAVAWMRSAWTQTDIEPEEVDLDELALIPPSDECWLVYLVRAPNYQADGTSDGFTTMLWVGDLQNEKCWATETLSESPTPDEIWDAFIQCVALPAVGLPRLPRRVVFLNGDLCEEFAADLEALGIEAVESEDDELRENVRNRERQLCERENFTGEISELPIVEDEPWMIDGRQLETWLTDDEGQLQRPWAIVVLGPLGIMFTHIMVQTPTPEDWQHAVEMAMRSPLVGEPHRPIAVFVRSPDHQMILEPILGEVLCEVGDDFSIADELLDALSSSMSGQSPLTPYVDVAGMSVERVGQFFESAAQYYRRAPWSFTPSDAVWEVQPAGVAQPWYAIVIGQNGETYGVSLIEHFDDCVLMMNGGMPDGGIMCVSAMCLNFDEAPALNGADLDAADQFGWPIAAPEAHPLVYRTGRSDSLETPSAAEFDLLDATIQTLPDFIASGQEFGTRNAVVNGTSVAVRFARVPAKRLKQKTGRGRW
ncbi:MAG: hypothetical protein ACKV2Q_09890 [Planctomycetaceae bacterium]